MKFLLAVRRSRAAPRAWRGLGFAFALALSLTSGAHAAPSVVVASGHIDGSIDPTYGSQAYYGIPYAQPPVGVLRWRATQPYGSFPGSAWNATAPLPDSKQCAQVENSCDAHPDPAQFGQAVVGSEDCLYLNVWRPNTGETNLPVFYWVHGGSNKKGTMLDPMYDGARFAARNHVIVVSVQYRLGYFGFLYQSALHTTSDPYDNSGNFLTLDLIQGLKWVQRNIPAFGGDPQRVTLGGQSAGCIDVWGLLQATTLAKGLFQRAICMSGFPNLNPTTLGQAAADQLVDSVLALNYDAAHPGSTVQPQDMDATRQGMSASAIRSLLLGASTETIARAAPAVYVTGHFIDGTVIPTLGLLNFNYDKVPLMLGTTGDDGSYFTRLEPLFYAPTPFMATPVPGPSSVAFPQKLDEATLWNDMNSGAALSDGDVLNAEWLPAAGQPFDTSRYFGTEHTTTEGIDLIVDNTIRYLTLQPWVCLWPACVNGSAPSPIFRYNFQWKNVPQPWRDVFGAVHAIDVPFLFGNFTTGTDNFLKFAWTSSNAGERETVSRLMDQYVLNFIWTGDPNASAAAEHSDAPYAAPPVWPQWTPWVTAQPWAFPADKRLIFTDAATNPAYAYKSNANYINALGVPDFFNDYWGLDCHAQRAVADEVLLSGVPSGIANAVGSWPWVVAPSCL